MIIVLIHHIPSHLMTTQLLIDFEWWRDAAGYRLVVDTTPPDSEAALIFHPLGIRIASEIKRLPSYASAGTSYRTVRSTSSEPCSEFSRTTSKDPRTYWSSLRNLDR